MITTPTDKNDSAVRDRTVFLGTDERGCDYYLKTEHPDTDVIRAIHGSQQVVYDRLHELRVEHVVATVAREVGWRDCRYEHWTVDPLPCKHA